MISSKVHRLAALDSNYIWMIQPDVHSPQVWVVDPGEAAPVLDAVAHLGLEPVALLITHHHRDHTGGIDALLALYPVPVWGPASERIPAVTHPLKDGDNFMPGTLQARVIATPGHTLDHLSYLIQPHQGPGWLFCGDTLFSAGCGRLFEGTPEQALASIQRLTDLDDTTLVYCAHEYTRQNLLFARHVEPDNDLVGQRLENIDRQIRDQGASLPSTIGQERLINPFLRLSSAPLVASLEGYFEQKTTSDLEVFTLLRRWKDHF